MKDLSLQERFVELRAKGMSYAKIAKEIDMSKQTMINWSKDLKVEVENMRQMNLEAMRERLKLGVNHRLETYSKLLEKAKAELEKRDFSDVPTEKLVSIIEKINEKAEQVDRITFYEERGLLDMMELEPTQHSWTA